MKKYIMAFMATMSLGLTSCSDWLDVKGDMEMKEEDLFSKKQGFCDALVGCYMTMADQSAYGEKLTMSNIESLAGHWDVKNDQSLPADYYLRKHDYEQDDARAAIQSIYGKLFNVVVQANVLLKNLEAEGDVIDDPALRAVIEGEAYALRAFCQFDILRLFGQLPQGGTLQVSLPYSETASIDDMPPYYKFSEYVGKLEADIEKALDLLEDSDPIFQYTFGELNQSSNQILDESSLYFRQSRMNYWAVKALQARMYLYLGNKTKAYQVAKEIITAKDVNGDALMELSGVSDLNAGYLACPSECLFYLSKFDILDYATSLLNGNAVQASSDRQLILSGTMFQDLYKGMNTASHNRYMKQWNRNVPDTQSNTFASTRKYYFNPDEVSSSLLYNLIVPMIRMSEIYLIAIETTTDLAEANSLYDTYIRDRNILLEGDAFASLADVQQVVVDEYRREFYAEGLMFYVYKRTNAKTMLWYNTQITESEYILPLPDTEFNPNDIQK